MSTFIGSRSGKNIFLARLSILVIGPKAFFEKISSPLQSEVKAKFKLPVNVSSAELVEDVIENTNFSTFDSIIMLVDTTRDKFSNEMMEALGRISAPHLATRLILVNGCSGSVNFFSNGEFKRIADHYNINYLNAEIKDPESCAYLVERLVGLIDLTVGITTGNPMPMPTTQILSSIRQFYYSQDVTSYQPEMSLSK